MNLSDLNPLAKIKLKRITDLLEQLHGLQLDWNTPEEYLQTVRNHYQERKQQIVSESYSANSEYTKSVLIIEAINIYLKEIAPHRKKNSRRKQ